MKYIVQYSYPATISEAAVAVSNWKEGVRVIDASSTQEAISKNNKLCEKCGTWMTLDCYPATHYDLNFYT